MTAVLHEIDIPKAAAISAQFRGALAAANVTPRREIGSEFALALRWRHPFVDPRGGRVEMDEMVAFGPGKYLCSIHAVNCRRH